jgi:hypothetical protein
LVLKTAAISPLGDWCSHTITATPHCELVGNCVLVGDDECEEGIFFGADSLHFLGPAAGPGEETERTQRRAIAHH